MGQTLILNKPLSHLTDILVFTKLISFLLELSVSQEYGYGKGYPVYLQGAEWVIKGMSDNGVSVDRELKGMKCTALIFCVCVC